MSTHGRAGSLGSGTCRVGEKADNLDPGQHTSYIWGAHSSVSRVSMPAMVDYFNSKNCQCSQRISCWGMQWTLCVLYCENYEDSVSVMVAIKVLNSKGPDWATGDTNDVCHMAGTDIPPLFLYLAIFRCLS